MAAQSRSFLWILAALAIGVLAAAGALGDDSGSVSGTVVDKYSGAPITEARVTVSEVAGSNRGRTKTNQIGRYSVVGLFAGQYEVVVSKDGFDVSLSKFTICPGGEIVVDVWLCSRNCLGLPPPKPKLYSTSSTIVTNSQWIGMSDLRCF